MANLHSPSNADLTFWLARGREDKFLYTALSDSAPVQRAACISQSSLHGAQVGKRYEDPDFVDGLPHVGPIPQCQKLHPPFAYQSGQIGIVHAVLNAIQR